MTEDPARVRGSFGVAQRGRAVDTAWPDGRCTMPRCPKRGEPARTYKEVRSTDYSYLRQEVISACEVDGVSRADAEQFG